MKTRKRDWLGALALFVMLSATPTLAEASEPTFIELGADVTFQCDAGWNTATVHNIPTGFFMTTDKPAAHTITASGIEFRYGTDGLTLLFAELGSFEIAARVPLLDNCWEAPIEAKLIPAISSDTVVTPAESEPYADDLEVIKAPARSMRIFAV